MVSAQDRQRGRATYEELEAVLAPLVAVYRGAQTVRAEPFDAIALDLSVLFARPATP